MDNKHDELVNEICKFIKNKCFQKKFCKGYKLAIMPKGIKLYGDTTNVITDFWATDQFEKIVIIGEAKSAKDDVKENKQAKKRFLTQISQYIRRINTPGIKSGHLIYCMPSMMSSYILKKITIEAKRINSKNFFLHFIEELPIKKEYGHTTYKI